MTSQNLWSRHVRHFVGINGVNEWRFTMLYSLPTVYPILISQPTANITPLKQLFCTSTITSSVQWDHRKYHASAYSTSLLVSTLLTMTSWSLVSHPGLVSMALFSAGSNLICHLAASVLNVKPTCPPGTLPPAVSPKALSLVHYSSSCTPLLSVTSFPLVP